MMTLSTKRDNYVSKFRKDGFSSVQLQVGSSHLMQHSEAANDIPTHVQSVYVQTVPKGVGTFILYEVRLHGSMFFKQ